jgi:electron transfer flavoprotein alpha/beta subunit
MTKKEKRNRISLSINDNLKKAVETAVELKLADNPTNYAKLALREKLQRDKIIGFV